MKRLDDLYTAREGLLRRMETCENDQNYATLVRQLQAVWAEIAELAPPEREEATGLDEFTRRLRERRSAS